MLNTIHSGRIPYIQGGTFQLRKSPGVPGVWRSIQPGKKQGGDECKPFTGNSRSSSRQIPVQCSVQPHSERYRELSSMTSLSHFQIRSFLTNGCRKIEAQVYTIKCQSY